jgi:transcriptional regulator with XRE-family HTH domain
MRKHGQSASEIGQRIREIRKKLKIQQKDMAAAMNIAASYLCDIENGKGNPGPEFFVRLATQFNINLNYLFIGAPDMFTDAEKKVQKQEVDLEDDVDTIEKVAWLMEHSIHLRTMVLTCVNRTIYADRDIIRENIKRKKAKASTDKIN